MRFKRKKYFNRILFIVPLLNAHTHDSQFAKKEDDS